MNEERDNKNSTKCADVLFSPVLK